MQTSDDRSRPEKSAAAPGPRSDSFGLLYVDMAYCLDELLKRKHFQFYEARHSGNYFSKVIGLHPLADRVTELSAPIVRRSFSYRQDVIEGSALALKMPKFLSPLNLFISQRRLLKHIIKIVADENLTFLAATDALYSGLFALWIARATGRPLIIYVVAHYENLHRSTGTVMMPKLIPFYWLEKAIARYVLKRADLVAAGSVKLGEYAQRLGANAHRIKHLRVAKNVGAQHRAPPSERRSPEPVLSRFGISRNRRLLLTVARLTRVKLVDHAIKSMKRIAAAHPDCILLLAGDGPERQTLEALSRQLGLERHIIFLGLLDQDALASIIPHAIALSPLTGMALYETSLGGAPAVAYDTDAQVSELVEDGVTGFLAPFQDVDAMAAAAIRILDDPKMASEMGIAIRTRALRITDPAINESIEHAAFDELLKITSSSRW